MRRLNARLKLLQDQNRSGLACYFTAGDPDFGTCLTLLAGLGAAGADLIELGIPFGDPVADGPAIQNAHLRARSAGQTAEKTLVLVAALRKTDARTPVVLMGYLNPIMQYGAARFMEDAVAAGVDALLLVDLPVEHASTYRELARDAGLELVAMTAPTSNDERLRKVLCDARGFVYHVALNGTTGAGLCSPEDVGSAIARIRRYTRLPIAAGFGIRDPNQARALAKHADIVVVGSQLVETLAHSGIEATIQAVSEFANVLRSSECAVGET